MFSYFGNYFSVLKSLLWFAELFALTGGYKTYVLQDCWNSDSSLKFTSQISLCSWEMLFGVSSRKEISELCGWPRIEGDVLLNYIISSCCLNDGKKTDLFLLKSKPFFHLIPVSFPHLLECTFTFLVVPSHMFPPLSPSKKSCLWNPFPLWGIFATVVDSAIQGLTTSSENSEKIY